MNIYAVEFDGYLCRNAWPEIGEPNTEIIEHFKDLRRQGHKLILWTRREGLLLINAIVWCASHGLIFDCTGNIIPCGFEWRRAQPENKEGVNKAQCSEYVTI